MTIIVTAGSRIVDITDNIDEVLTRFEPRKVTFGKAIPQVLRDAIKEYKRKQLHEEEKKKVYTPIP